MLFAQFSVKACVKLRDTSSVRIETGQYSYLQIILLFRVLGLDVLIVKTCKDIVSDVKRCVCSDYRCSA